MSFILEDKKLFDDLMKGLFKSAQDTSQSPENILAKKLINKLERQYTNSPEPLNISSGVSGTVGLNVPDLQSLDKFLQFLNANQIKLNNSAIVYNNKEYQSLSQEERDKLSTISAKISRDASTRKWNESDFFVNLPSLIQYVKYLQDKATAMEKAGDVQGQILRVMIGKLIDSINSITPNSGLSRNKQKSTPENPNVLADDTVLDDFNTKTFDAKSPYADKGTNQIKLYAKDLKSKESLNAWLLGDDGSEATIISYDASGQKINLPFSDEKANPCVMVNVLYLRANRWLQLSKSEQDTKKYNYYVNKIKELGPTYADPNGGACTIGGSTSKSQMTALVPGKDDGATGTGSNVGGTLTPAIMNEIVSNLPFALRDIDFNRIRRFFDSVKKAVGNNQAVSYPILSRINQAEAFMEQFSSMTINKDLIIPLGMNPLQFMRMLSNQQKPASQMFPALTLLDEIIDTTRGVVESFYSAYANIITDRYSNYVPYILGQIGRNPDDPSIYSRNATSLENLRTAGKVI